MTTDGTEIPQWGKDHMAELEARGCVIDFRPDIHTIYHTWHSVDDFASVENIREKLASGDLSTRLGKHVDTIEEATLMIREGRVSEYLFERYNEARDTLDSLVDEFAALAPTTKKRRVLGDDGDTVNVDRVLTGDAACWESRKRGAARAFVRIGVQFSTSWGTEEEVFVKTATLATAGSDILERLGYMTEIIGFAEHGGYSGSGYFRDWNFVSKVIVKSSDMPLDSQAVLALGMPAFFRVVQFANLGGYDKNGAYQGSMPGRQKNSPEFLDLNAEIGHEMDFSKGACDYDEVLDGFLKRAAEALR